MKQTAEPPSLRRRFVAAVALVHFLAVLALAASPRFHAWVHPDEADDDGDCAVVLLLHGACEHGPGPVAAPADSVVWQTTAAMVGQPLRVPSVFAVCGMLEHAPPRSYRTPIV